jgi:RNA polymerase sigma factor (sigma-70 family)
VNNIISNPLTDQLLVNRVLGGDTRAFGLIVKNTEGLVAQILFRMIPTAEDRKDLAQDIYLKTYSKLSGFKFESKLSTWIGQIAYNTCLNYLEKKKLLLPGNLHVSNDDQMDYPSQSIAAYWHDESQETETIIFRKEIRTILQAGIDSLTPIFKTLITLYHQEGLNYEEVVSITGLPEGTVKSYLFRARKALKDELLLNYKKDEL